MTTEAIKNLVEDLQVMVNLESHLGNEARLPPNFKLTENGLFFLKEDDEGNANEIFICSNIKISAYLRDNESSSWGRLLEFQDASGHPHSWGMPMSMLKGSGEDLRGELLDRGVLFGYGATARNKFLEYITCSLPAMFARCVTQIGWHGRVFVLPSCTIGDSKEKIVFQTEFPSSSFKTKGTVEEWKENIAKYCAGNSRLVLSVSCAFAAMLLELLGEDSGGINLFGESSSGKTTALLVAASVYGESTYLSRWRATVNGLEALAESRNDCLLILDEMAQIDPKEAGNAIYTLANGSGKVRANQYGGTRSKNTWRILFLSSGEIDLNQHISESGKKTTAGQQVRCIDIPADAGMGFGVFENLHDFSSGSEFSNFLKEMAGKYYGIAMIEFLKKITNPENISIIPDELKELRDRITSPLKNDIGGQVKRVVNRLTLISYAGELATKYGLTGWDKGEAVNAVKKCLTSWIDHRGGTGNQEKSFILRQVKSFFEAHGSSRFENIDCNNQTVVHNRVGFKKKSINDKGENVDLYYALPEALKEICKGYDQRLVIKTLIEAGWLIPNNEGKNSQRVSVPGMGRKRVYVFSENMWDD